MKKAGVAALIVSALCLSFLLGLFLGRTLSPSPILVSRPLKDNTETIPTLPSHPQLMVNINTADAQQLQQLPGIGPVIAQRIITYRETNGPFASVSQLTMIDGVSILVLENILDYITVGGTYEDSGS